ncbi:hypothetical protein CEXT_603981 [Caerostris extrusa]|uniref:Uncharacterized protein n=1 Tax=Caerostris extrusa TaxID=172846 RepID=A0AAV4SXU0_CAEEX|nr:hypothetical protein CEXT_603981 [Caerostris extrusa]
MKVNTKLQLEDFQTIVSNKGFGKRGSDCRVIAKDMNHLNMRSKTVECQIEILQNNLCEKQCKRAITKELHEPNIGNKIIEILRNSFSERKHKKKTFQLEMSYRGSEERLWAMAEDLNELDMQK